MQHGFQQFVQHYNRTYAPDSLVHLFTVLIAGIVSVACLMKHSQLNSLLLQEYSKGLSNWLQGLLDNLRNYKQRCRLPSEDIRLDTVAQQVCMFLFVYWTGVPPNLLGSEWHKSFCASCSFLGVNVQIGDDEEISQKYGLGQHARAAG